MNKETEIKNEYRRLFESAEKARKNAYAPYSGFRVGAALLCSDGCIYTGVNIENSSYSATLCAERSAFSAAITDGKHDFAAIAVAGGKNDVSDDVYPCGVCLQFMCEFCGDDFKIITKHAGGLAVNTLSELVPKSFEAKNIK